jgi:hypothetical protein
MIVALDTSILLRLADADDETWDAHKALLKRGERFQLIVTPAVNDLLEMLARGSNKQTLELTRRVWRGRAGDWHIAQASLSDAQKKMAWVLNCHFRQAGLLDEGERLEAEVLAEAVVRGDELVASPGSPLCQIDARRLLLETRLLGMSGFAVFEPRQLLTALAD